eukprot:CAMPEP_0204584138 /NCGR_PEP_ID=MMETSP0661-20131031/46175_1 /ASSEMBLY_ACC=CAM_ASM_000606 /TAXON_ID=109239 /ORGANISM="Alexandrium margalefi, Strain AMGDE01CS-322" /LENGTH=35 /DNA_ID= /DNA_START= /DNA_END= /DNA_ORIENTATION=
MAHRNADPQKEGGDSHASRRSGFARSIGKTLRRAA